ncbi:hypothetical protein [Brumicola blandensis]|uniref:DUF7947 domain-containing protein n=1 Tax=Brumicola blandensis TaxID=3075611 RepID=A0AAW8QX89_9ALTE|nr:hypothetical protein [Alteromonas sp. W409]MDT0581552.1 hypothetical protein [Alteromonas sp. W409]
MRKQGNKINGAKLFINPSRKGSFEELLTIIIENNALVGIGASVVGAAFYDLLKLTWSKTFNQDYEPTTPTVKRLIDRKEPFIGEMEEALEIPLEQAHRPIRQHRDMSIIITRPRDPYQIIKLDNDTLQSVSIRTENEVVQVVGNVTRYNIISGIGRFYDDDEEKTISFKIPDDAGSSQRRRITWSLHNAQTDGEGKIRLEVKKIVSARGVTRRYLVQKVHRI